VKGLEEIWWRAPAGAPRGPLGLALSAGEGLFRGAAAARRALYRSGLVRPHRAPVPVVSVGNLTVGGAGKTPVALLVAARLRARGRKVAVLSRGYGARRADPRVVSDGERLLLGAAEAGDEPLLLARRLPGTLVLCGPSRAELSRRAVALGADALVLDDGFQHLGLARDLDIVVLDGRDPFGNGHLLPRGPNRELPSALGRAHLAWISQVDRASPERLALLRTQALAATGHRPVESRHAVEDVLDGLVARSCGADALAGRRTLLLCALARPDGFRATLLALGAEVVAERVYRDHHLFSEREVALALEEAEAKGCEVVATTEKDAVRLPERLARDTRFRVVRIGAEVVAGGEVLEELLLRVLRAGAAPREGPG